MSSEDTDAVAAQRTGDVSVRWKRRALLCAVFVCAACGLVYELSLIALGSYLVGSSITQTSLVVSIVLFAMGVGALAAKPLSRRPVISFASVEFALGMVGAASVPALYGAYAWLDLYTPGLLVASILVGGLVGAEIPLLMKLVQMVRAQDASEAVADLSATDYIGALVGGLAFPFVLLPTFGLVRGAIVVGAVNLVAGALVAGWLFGSHLTPMARGLVRITAVVLVLALGAGAVLVDDLEVSARQALYDDPIVFSERSQYQEIVVTRSSIVGRGVGDVRLYLNGNLQFASVDEYRYHEALVHPAMNGERSDVLVLGGGDGLAAREALRYRDVESLTLVELDPTVIDIARNNDLMTDVNGASLDDLRVEIVDGDAFTWVQANADRDFDVIIADFPDPDSLDVSKLYSVEFYGYLARMLDDGGRLVVQSGSPYFAPDAFWCVVETIGAAGLHTTPYHVDVPSFGDWGFTLATAGAAPSVGIDASIASELRFMDADQARAATVFPRDRGDRDVDASTLLDPTVLQYQRNGWRQD